MAAIRDALSKGLGAYLLNMVAAALPGVALIAWGWVGQTASKSDVEAVRTELRGVSESVGVAARQSTQGHAALREELKALHGMSTEQLAWLVRMKAADAEPRRARKADAANAAEILYRKLLRQGDVDPINAARRALEIMPAR